MVSPLQILGCPGITGALQQMVFVGNIQGSEDRQTRRIHGVGLLRNSAHLGIDVLSQFNDVVSVGAAKIVGLVENFHSDSIIAGIFQRRMFRDGCHNLFAPSGSSVRRGTQLAACCSSAMVSICCSIFSTRPRISSRSLRRLTISRRIVSTSSSRSSSAWKSSAGTWLDNSSAIRKDMIALSSPRDFYVVRAPSPASELERSIPQKAVENRGTDG